MATTGTAATTARRTGGGAITTKLTATDNNDNNLFYFCSLVDEAFGNVNRTKKKRKRSHRGLIVDTPSLLGLDN